MRPDGLTTYLYLASHFVLALGVSACHSKIETQVERNTNSRSATGVMEFFFPLAIAAASDLPECNSTGEGRLVFSVAEQQFSVCSALVWKPIDLKGASGPKGDGGPEGSQGLQGVQGPEGSQGPKGSQGSEGSQGAQGAQGLVGPTSGVDFGQSIKTSGLNLGLVTDGGLVGIGTLTPMAKLQVEAVSATSTSEFTTIKEGGGSGAWNQIVYRNSAWGPQILGLKAMGSVSTPSAVLSGHHLLDLNGAGFDGTSFFQGANIYLMSAENWTSTSRGTQISFSTTTSGTILISERMRIDGKGNVGIGNSAPKATLDVSGFMRLARNAVAPVACIAAQDGSLAMTSTHKLCICDGAAWVQALDGVTACTW